MSCGVASASDARTPLVRDAFVNGGSVYLSDLLPESASSPTRSQARDIRIGTSPQPGSVRVLSSDEILRLLDGGNILGKLEVPSRIVIHRSGHLITREEVAEAIRRTLSRNEEFRGVQVLPENVRLAARISVPTSDAQLRVTRIEWDQTIREMKFSLVSGSGATLVPFMVIVNAACAACDSTETVRRISAETVGTLANVKATSADPSSARHVDPPPVLVESGQSASLHFVSNGRMQMYLIATSLEKGALGQNIRVKIQSTGKILVAHVIGRGQLEAEL